MKVLLVEDEAALADVLSRNLRVRGNDVTVEGSAEGAIQRIAENLPDTLVLDINLPDQTGWEVLRHLTPEERQKLNVVIISAAPISTKRLAEFEPSHWFLKPFPVEALMRAVANVAPEELGIEDLND